MLVYLHFLLQYRIVCIKLWMQIIVVNDSVKTAHCNDSYKKTVVRRHLSGVMDYIVC